MATTQPLKDLVLLRIIDSYEYSPLSRSIQFKSQLSELNEARKAMILDGFARFLTEEIKRKVQESIRTQKFKVAFQPLTAKYVDFKKRNKLEEGFWKSTNYLVNHIKVWKYANEYRVGFPSTAYYMDDEGNKTIQIVVIAKTLEFGSTKRNIPARPVFRPIVRDMSQHIARYLDRYLSTIDWVTFTLPKPH